MTPAQRFDAIRRELPGRIGVDRAGVIGDLLALANDASEESPEVWSDSLQLAGMVGMADPKATSAHLETHRDHLMHGLAVAVTYHLPRQFNGGVSALIMMSDRFLVAREEEAKAAKESEADFARWTAEGEDILKSIAKMAEGMT